MRLPDLLSGYCLCCGIGKLEMHSGSGAGTGLDLKLRRETCCGNESAEWWQRKKRTMGGSVMKRSRRKHWRKSPQSRGTRAAGRECGVWGSSRQISEAREKSTLDLSLQGKAKIFIFIFSNQLYIQKLQTERVVFISCIMTYQRSQKWFPQSPDWGFQSCQRYR